MRLVTRHRVPANASLPISDYKVTHRMSGSIPNDSRVCQGCRKHFRPKRSWQKQCSPRSRQRVNLLALAAGDAFIAKAQVKRAGRKLTVCTADAFAVTGDKQKVVATMLATIMALPTGAKTATM